MRPLALTTLAVLAVLPACDNTDPVSPQALTVLLNAEPPAIEPGQASTIAISAFDPSGSPAARAPALLETTLGRLTRSQLLLDGSGRGSTVLEAGEEPGTATITATVTLAGLASTATVDVEIMTPQPPEVFLEVTPTALDQQHSRSLDACPNPFEPALTVGPVAASEVDYRVVEDLPVWLAVGASSGSTPATVTASYTCAEGDGDLDLAHTMQLQAVEPVSGSDLGDPVNVAITLRVRD